MQPARNVIEKCGGAKQVAFLAGCTTNWVYRWLLSREAGGTGGVVPQSARKKLLKAAKAGIVPLTPADFEEGWV